ncbi:MAG: GAF domain-containing protein, partial [Planctomycetota bacterium]
MMSEKRPKLFLMAGDSIPTDAMRARLAEQFDLVERESEDLAGAATGDVAIVPIDRLARLSGDVGSRLLNSIGEGVSLMSHEGALVWANERYRALSQASRDRLEQVAREATDWFAQRLMQPGARLAELTCKFELSSGDLEEQLEVYISPVAGDDPESNESSRAASDQPKPNQPEPNQLAPVRPKVTQLAVVVRDVTALKRRMRKIDTIDRAGAALVRIDASEIRDMNAAERLALLERRLVHSFHELLQFDHFGIRLFDDATGKLELVISQGLPAEAADFDIYPGAEGNGISGWVFATGRSYICDDAMADDLFLPGLEGARSSLTVPLRLHDRVLGVLNIESGEAAAFNEEDRQFAEIFARYIAMSLHILDMLVVEGSTVNKV